MEKHGMINVGFYLKKGSLDHPKVCDGCFNENHNHYYYKVFLKSVHINNIKMLYYARTEVSEGINVNMTSVSK